MRTRQQRARVQQQPLSVLWQHPSYIYVVNGPAGPVMYIADQQYQLIRRCVENTGSCTVVAQNGVGAPTDVFLDPSLNIYVAEYPNYRVTKWTPGNTTAGALVAGGNGVISEPHLLPDVGHLRRLAWRDLRARFM
ncbi:unnamed protein product [Didymodactylos carnosus]|uniref:Uncharacterized protein n=1 Tax=Didymodactylos carnosus TaxID=1234261 RepID=A0A815PFB9_9BILA|nr:unnamed protein product [Didymodactylos carnosus]CAF1448633.1 unnamed protein product [Didymodactylos carnosus]CAF3638408.1 unnamed protein product [Didymodactylos carnosus]CAF4322601.1 unnamed protein product [Didymodactylos carnosus]